VSVVARGTNSAQLEQVVCELTELLSDLGGNPVEEDLDSAQSQSHIDD